MKDKEFSRLIGANLRKARKARKAAGLTQQYVAEFLGLSFQNSISQIEAGKNQASAEQIYTLCHLYNCRLRDIFPPMVKVGQGEREMTV